MRRGKYVGLKRKAKKSVTKKVDDSDKIHGRRLSPTVNRYRIKILIQIIKKHSSNSTPKYVISRPAFIRANNL